MKPISLRFPLILVFLIAFAAVRPLNAQRTANLTIGIRPASQQLQTHPAIARWRADDHEANEDPYLVIGALVGAGLVGVWEARAVSQSGDDVMGGSILLIPPVAGAVLGAFGGWLIFKIVHSKPAD